MIYAFLAIASAQYAGHGISKNTYACSSAVTDTVFAFMMKYFPVEESPDDCDNRQCTCGKQGRTQLLLDSANVDYSAWESHQTERRRQPPGGPSGFGLHCVYAPGKDNIRWKQSGNMTVEEIETVFMDKFKSVTDKSKYLIALESNTGLYTSNLESFTNKLDDDGVKYFSLSWSSGSKDYMSAFVHPGGQIIHEVIGPASTASDTMRLKAVEHPSPRFDFGEAGPPNVTQGYMTAMWVSHTTTDVARDASYFKSVFGLGFERVKTSSGTGPDGNSYKMAQITMSSTATTAIRLIQPADTNSGSYSVAWWEDYINSVHDQYMKSAHCGWDVLADNHLAYDWLPFQTSLDQGTIVQALSQQGYKYFCVAAKGPRDAHCYVNTPFGRQIQLDGSYSDPPSTYHTYDNTDLCATYLEYCD